MRKKIRIVLLVILAGCIGVFIYRLPTIIEAYKELRSRYWVESYTEEEQQPTAEIIAKDPDKWARSDDPYIRQLVAEHHETPSEILALLARDEDKFVRRAVAYHPGISLLISEILVTDEDLLTRQIIAGRAQIPLSLQEKIAQDKDVRVKWALARNYDTAPAILNKLVTDFLRLPQLKKVDHTLVMREVAGNPNTPAEILSKLVQEEAPFKEEKWDVRSIIVEHPNATREILIQLVQDEEERVRSIAQARIPDTSIETLRKLSTDSFANVRRAVAGNSATPKDILEQLTRDPDVYVAQAARKTLGK